MPQIIAETFATTTCEGSNNSVRLRPVEGQGFARDVRIKFSNQLRYDVPVGTLFKIWVTEVNHPTKPYLASSGEPVLVSQEDAFLFISKNRKDIRE